MKASPNISIEGETMKKKIKRAVNEGMGNGGLGSLSHYQTVSGDTDSMVINFFCFSSNNSSSKSSNDSSSGPSNDNLSQHYNNYQNNKNLPPTNKRLILEQLDW